MTNVESARDAAIKRLRNKRDFRTHVAAYVVVNALLVTIWAVTGGGYFWPIWAIAGWGVGLALNAWTVYFERPVTDQEIQHEMDRVDRDNTYLS